MRTKTVRTNWKKTTFMWAAVLTTVFSVACAKKDSGGDSSPAPTVAVVPTSCAVGVPCPYSGGVGVGAQGQLLLSATGQSNELQFKFDSYGDPNSYQAVYAPWNSPKAPVFYNGVVWGQGQMLLNVNACQAAAGTVYTLQTIQAGSWSNVIISNLKMQAIPTNGAGPALTVTFNGTGFYNPNTVSRDQTNRLFGNVTIDNCGTVYLY